MYRIELHHWINNQGYTHSETFDHSETLITAENYAKSLDDDLTPDNPDEAINVEVYNEDDELLSEYWLQK